VTEDGITTLNLGDLKDNEVDGNEEEDSQLKSLAC